MSRIYEKLFSSPLGTVLSSIAIVIVGYGIAVCLPFSENISHGSLSQLSTEDTLVLKGHEVYYQEGCQYCHSQNLRPFGWEVSRYVNVEKYGYYPVPTAMEYSHETPAMRGSFRIGPDLSRVAGKQDAAGLTSLLRGGKEDNLRNRYHAYGYLFNDDDLQPLFLSWKIRMMLEAGVPLSDPYHKSAFDRLEGQTRGDALVAYLLSLGQKSMQYNGAFYR